MAHAQIRQHKQKTFLLGNLQNVFIIKRTDNSKVIFYSGGATNNPPFPKANFANKHANIVVFRREPYLLSEEPKADPLASVT